MHAFIQHLRGILPILSLFDGSPTAQRLDNPWLLLVLFVPILIVLFRKLTLTPVILTHHPHPVSIEVCDDKSGQTTKESFVEYIRRKCPSLAAPRQHAFFYPTLWLANGHLQTFYTSVGTFEKLYKVVYDRFVILSFGSFSSFLFAQRPRSSSHLTSLALYSCEIHYLLMIYSELLKTPDGGTISIDWAPPLSVKPADNTPTLVLLHGLTGGSFESYIRDLVDTMTRVHGYRCVVFNARACADTALTSPQLFSGGYTDDLRLAVKHIRTTLPGAKLMGAGFSMGSNILMNYMAEESDQCEFLGAMSVSNPFDMLGYVINLATSSIERRCDVSSVRFSSLLDTLPFKIPSS